MSEDTESQANLEITARLVELFKTERSDRDTDWVNSFLADIPLAAMRTGKEQVISGPDGFLYFCLFVPEDGEKFSPVCLDDVVGFCSKEGLGITVFNANQKEPEWVFNYGSVWNYNVFKDFYNNPFSQNPEILEESTTEDKRSETVLISSPSEEYLPLFVRAVILRDLDQQQVNKPSMLLMTVPDEASYLVFNVFPEDFDESHYEFLQQYLIWVLPQGFSTATIPSDSDVCEHFVTLRESLQSPMN